MECASTFKDRRQLSLMDLKESDRTTMIEDTVERAVSVESKHTVECVLAQVRQLSPIEKLLLYLKLPNGRSSVDPLRQPMNPLGSRLEIHHTITWIKTHLQEDPEVSLPKQDVYDQYLDFCQVNSVKPLSTADFGKVMKQVYPNVRPRRLGTRGHSRYCYAGLRKRIRLAPPLLPDLGPVDKCALEDSGGGKAGSPERTLLVAVSVLIREWAGKTLGLRFSSLQELACHLVQSMAVNSQSTAALTVLSALTLPAPRSAGHSRPTSSSASLGSEGRPPSECSAGPSRPASETPRSLTERDHKRKSQEDVERLRLKTSDIKVRGKRTKHRSSSSPLEHNVNGGRRPVFNKSVSTITVSSCDSSVNSHTVTGMQFDSGRDDQAGVQNSTLLNSGSSVSAPTMPSHPVYSNVPLSVPESSDVASDVSSKVGSLRSDGLDGKLPIPRLPKPNSKQSMHNFVVFPPPVQQRQQNQFQPSSGSSQKQKYKLIKPKPFPEMEKSLKEADEGTSHIVSRQPNTMDINSSHIHNGSSKRKESVKTGNDAIIGCLEKDALDDYLHGGSNSQEQEEELMQYFPQQAPAQNQSMQIDSSTSFDKISQLRLLLERNMNQEVSGKTVSYQNGMSAAASLSLLSQRSQQKQNLVLPSILSNQQNVSRRVSFEVPGDPDSANNSVPPSPNTKQRFSFTPISPRPYSPTKSSSANASPFVSPRSTPVPRLKMNAPTGTLFMSAASNPCSLSGKPGLKAGMSRTMVRSMSVNSEASPMSPFQNVIPRSSVVSSKYVQDSNQMLVDVKPDLSALQEANISSNMVNNPYHLNHFNPSQISTNTLPPLHISKQQFPVSMSAPQSPVIHNSKCKKSGLHFRKEARALSLEMDSMNSSLMPIGLKTSLAQPTVPFSGNFHPQSSANFGDKYSQEISDLFPEDEVMLSLPSMPPMSSFRSQSVPLRRMVNSATVSPMPSTTLPSPHFGHPHGQHGIFNFNQFTPSNGSSVAPTPVPSEVTDFGIDSDIVHPSPAANNMHDYDMRDGDTNCNTSQGDGIGSDSLNPDLLNEMFRMLEEGKSDPQQSHQSGFSQSYPDAPTSFKPDPDSTLRGDPLFTAFRLEAVGSENGACPEEQLDLNGGSTVGASTADPILNELNSMANASGSHQEMNILLEEAPSSFMAEDLECEISQLAREVGDTSSQ